MKLLSEREDQLLELVHTEAGEFLTQLLEVDARSADLPINGEQELTYYYAQTCVYDLMALKGYQAFL